MSTKKTIKAVRRIIQQQADAHGVTYDEAYKDLENIISVAMASKETGARMFWNNVKSFAKKEIPTPEDFIMYTSVTAKVMSM